MNLSEASEKLKNVDWDKAINEGSVNKLELKIVESNKLVEQKPKVNMFEGKQQLFD